MKYQVQIKYTNPSHEHVTLRRRVESVTRLVEAANEQEALNRAANQQRALGFIIKEAAVYAPVTGLHSLALNNNEPQKGKEKKKKLVGDDNEVTDVGALKGVKEAAGGTASYPLLKKGEKLKPMKMSEGFDPNPSDIAAYLVDKHGKGKVTKDHVDAYERGRDSNKGIDKEAVMKHVQKMSEEVELDEAQKKLKPSYWKAEWRLGTQSEVDKNNKKIFDKLAKTDPVKASAFHDNLMRMRKKDMKEEVVGEAAKDWKKAFQNVAAKNYEKDVAAVRSSASRLDKATQSFPAKPDTKPTDSNIEYVKQNVRRGVTKPHPMQEEVVTEASKEGKDVMRNMRASLKSMDLRHSVDADKRVSGYKMSPAVKAAQAKSDALSKVVKRPQAGTLAAAKMKKEAAENNGKQKARKAAEKMVNRAKSKANKIDVEPSIEPGKPNA